MAFKIEGMSEIAVQIERAADVSKVEKNLKKACTLVERSAKQKAPKGNGELRRSITSKIEEDKGIVYSPLLYAPYVEYGTGLFAENGGRTDVPWVYQDDEGEWHSTSGMSPQPYLRPALEENREAILAIFKEEILK